MRWLIRLKSGYGAVWFSALALEARGRRFKSFHPDHPFKGFRDRKPFPSVKPKAASRRARPGGEIETVLGELLAIRADVFAAPARSQRYLDQVHATCRASACRTTRTSAASSCESCATHACTLTRMACRRPSLATR